MIENKKKYESSECELEHGCYSDEWYEKEFEKERAWLFYESGVQDMREIKRLIWVYKF